MAQTFRRGLFTLLLAVPAFATTWVVDVNPGPGVDFSTIGAAIQAAQPGDTILVMPGSYPTFTLDKGVNLLAPQGANIQNWTTVRVQDIQAGRRAVVSGLTLYQLRVRDCDAPVILDRMQMLRGLGYVPTVEVERCADVRFRKVEINLTSGAEDNLAHGLLVRNARVEVTGSQVRGQPGNSGSGGHGGDGVHCAEGAIVHVSRSTCRGGEGGSYFPDNPWDPFGFGGSAGSGAWVAAGATLLVTGTSADAFIGAWGGSGPRRGEDGSGITVLSGGYARTSGVNLIGAGFEPSPLMVYPGGIADQVTPADPSLGTDGPQSPGDAIEFVLRGPVGSSARLRLGRASAVVDVSDTFEDRLLVPLRTFSLGAIPPTGEVRFPITLSPSLPLGTTIFAQGSVTGPGGETELTQSVPLVVR